VARQLVDQLIGGAIRRQMGRVRQVIDRVIAG
jgi:hypothetical protein